MAKPNEVFSFKILIIGDSSVGKSSLMTRYVDNTFQHSFFPTIGVDFKVRTIEIDGYSCKVQIWDTAGQERFRVITTTYYRDADGVLIVYDVTNGETFARIRRWVEEINKYCEENIPKILVGNKADITPMNDGHAERVVLTEDAEQYAEKMHMPFFETSAKDNVNIDETFFAISRLALKRRLDSRNNHQSSQHGSMPDGKELTQLIRLKETNKKERKYRSSCCK